MSDFINIHTHHFTHSTGELQAVGIHPWEADKVELKDISEAMFADAQAIGEIGLDYACKVDRERQRALFCHQLHIAERLQKVVVLHCVKAFEPTMNLLLRYSPKAVIFHGFIGSKEQAEQALSRGYYLSFGHRTARSPKTSEALRTTPLDRLFVETDQSDRSIEEMYEEIARLRGIEVEALAEHTARSYKRIFEEKR